jgi:reactive intermediate/imine deaminase
VNKQIIYTKDAPEPIGAYSQAVKVGNTVYLSGQIGIDPSTSQLLFDLTAQIEQMFKNLAAVAHAAHGDLSKIAKLNLYLVDMNNFTLVNQIMMKYFSAPYPARAAVAVRELPKGALVEADAVMVVD